MVSLLLDSRQSFFQSDTKGTHDLHKCFERHVMVAFLDSLKVSWAETAGASELCACKTLPFPEDPYFLADLQEDTCCWAGGDGLIDFLKAEREPAQDHAAFTAVNSRQVCGGASFGYPAE